MGRVQPRLTIAIPTLNRCRLVRRAIESALAQTSPDVEILLSDNGSTDGTPEIIAGYAGRVRTFHHVATMSAARHGQFLMEQARGEFFLGLSDDDFLEPEFAAEVLNMFDQHPELAFVYTGCAWHYEHCQVAALVGPPVESGAEFLAAHYAGKREICWCACVTRVHDLLKLGPQPDDRILGDMFFWTKLAFHGPVGCVPRVLSHYVLFRSQNDNISHGTPPSIWAREARVLADEVIEGSRRAGANRDYLSQLVRDCRRHIARSVANQFVWARLRGASIGETWKSLAECAPYLCCNPKVISRAGAALVVPRKVLRYMLLQAAAAMAKARRASERRENGC